MSSAVRERMIIKLIITVIFLMGNIIYPQDKNGKSLIDDLVDASFTGDIVKVKDLLEKKVNVNTQDREGMTPLHYTTANGSYPEIIQILLSQGADRTLMNNNGKTALDIAKEMGNKKMITILSK